MNTYILGIDIADEHISAALLTQQRTGEIKVLSVQHGPVRSQGQLLPLGEMLGEVARGKIRCIMGLPLSQLSLRNLFLPFSDPKKISQTLPFELEEQLISPVDQLRIEYLIGEETEGSSKILAVALHREVLARYVHALGQDNISPTRVCPAAPTLAEQVVACSPQLHKNNLIILDTGPVSADLLLYSSGKLRFMRRIPYPEIPLSSEPANFIEQMRNDRDTASDYITEFYQAVERNIGHFQRVNDSPPFDKLVLTGVMATDDFFAHETSQQSIFNSLIGQPLQLEVEIVKLLAVANLDTRELPPNSYSPSLHDRAIGLAMQGFQKESSLDFFKDNISAFSQLLSNKTQMVTLLGVLGALLAISYTFLLMTHSGLQTRFDELDGGLRTIYQETFPGSPLRADPYLQMRSKLMELHDPSDGVPLFPTEKQALNILADISARVPEKIAIHINLLIIDQDFVRLKGNTGTFNDVNSIKSHIGQSLLYESVEILSATADTKKNNIRFDLKLQLTGED